MQQATDTRTISQIADELRQLIADCDKARVPVTRCTRKLVYSTDRNLMAKVEGQLSDIYYQMLLGVRKVPARYQVVSVPKLYTMATPTWTFPSGYTAGPSVPLMHSTQTWINLGPAPAASLNGISVNTSISRADFEFLKSQEYTVDEICAAYGIPADYYEAKRRQAIRRRKDTKARTREAQK